MHNASNRRILSSGLVAEVEHCAGCEIMHLHIGAFTLRMKAVALHDLRDTLSRALAALPAHDTESTIDRRHASARRILPLNSAMHRTASRQPASRQSVSRPAGFALTATVLFAAGLLSALIDGTLGWEYIALELLDRLSH